MSRLKKKYACIGILGYFDLKRFELSVPAEKDVAIFFFVVQKQSGIFLFIFQILNQVGKQFQIL